MKVGEEYSWRSVPQMPTKAGALESLVSYPELGGLVGKGEVVHFDLVVQAFRFIDLVYAEVFGAMESESTHVGEFYLLALLLVLLYGRGSVRFR